MISIKNLGAPETISGAQDKNQSRQISFKPFLNEVWKQAEDWGQPLQRILGEKISEPPCVGSYLIGWSLDRGGLGRMIPRPSQRALAILVLMATLLLCSCGKKGEAPEASAVDPHLKTMGTVEVTARLEEIPEGAIFQRDLYDYATILKYQVIKVHRGQVEGGTIYVGHYNPFKPRGEASDRRVTGLGGNLRNFQAGQRHHMALEAPIEDYFMGGIVNKYFGQSTGTVYWAVWTDLAEK